MILQIICSFTLTNVSHILNDSSQLLRASASHSNSYPSHPQERTQGSFPIYLKSPSLHLRSICRSLKLIDVSDTRIVNSNQQFLRRALSHEQNHASPLSRSPNPLPLLATSVRSILLLSSHPNQIFPRSRNSKKQPATSWRPSIP